MICATQFCCFIFRHCLVFAWECLALHYEALRRDAQVLHLATWIVIVIVQFCTSSYTYVSILSYLLLQYFDFLRRCCIINLSSGSCNVSRLWYLLYVFFYFCQHNLFVIVACCLRSYVRVFFSIESKSVIVIVFFWIYVFISVH